MSVGDQAGVPSKKRAGCMILGLPAMKIGGGTWMRGADELQRGSVMPWKNGVAMAPLQRGAGNNSMATLIPFPAIFHAMGDSTAFSAVVPRPQHQRSKQQPHRRHLVFYSNRISQSHFPMALGL